MFLGKPFWLHDSWVWGEDLDHMNTEPGLEFIPIHTLPPHSRLYEWLKFHLFISSPWIQISMNFSLSLCKCPLSPPGDHQDYKSLSMVPCLETAGASAYSLEGFTGLFIVTENANVLAVNIRRKSHLSTPCPTSRQMETVGECHF